MGTAGPEFSGWSHGISMVLIKWRQEGQRRDGDMVTVRLKWCTHRWRKCQQLLEWRGSRPLDPAQSIQMERRASHQFLSICLGWHFCDVFWDHRTYSASTGISQDVLSSDPQGMRSPQVLAAYYVTSWHAHRHAAQEPACVTGPGASTLPAVDRCFSCYFLQNMFKLLYSQYLLVNKISRPSHAVPASSDPFILYKYVYKYLVCSRGLWSGAGWHSILLTLLSSFEEWTSVWSMIKTGNRQHENNVSGVLNTNCVHHPFRHEHMPLSFPLSSVTRSASGWLSSVLPTPLAQHGVTGGEG